MNFRILVVFGLFIGLDRFKTFQETLILPFLVFLYFLVIVLKKVREAAFAAAGAFAPHHNPIKNVSKNRPSKKKEKVQSEIQRQTSDLRAADFSPTLVPWLLDAGLTRRNGDLWAKIDENYGACFLTFAKHFAALHRAGTTRLLQGNPKGFP
jgi:hypothetical protein